MSVLGRRTVGWAAVIFLGTLAATTAGATEKLSLGLNWLPQAEHCGFYQAQDKGLYAAKGLDVEIVPGGPEVNMSLLLANGRVDLAVTSMLGQLKMSAENIPVVSVAAYFQKDPQTLVAHPDPKLKSIADLKGRPMLIASYAREEFWQWLKAKYGFVDEQLRPYTYNAGPFLADETAVQQGYITNDGFVLGGPLGGEPKIFLLADSGYLNYQDVIQATTDTVANKPDLIKGFVAASAEGWKQCVAGDFAAAEDAVLKASPDQSKAMFEYSMKELIERKIVIGEDGAPIGGISEARVKDFTAAMQSVGVVPKTVDYKTAFTTKFQ
jgi:NitT/TauT family transport system substrate-binding protein